MDAVAARFSRHAAAYEAHAVVQKEVAARLLDFMRPYLPENSTGVGADIGAGTGMFSRMLAAHWPAMSWLALDSAPGSLRLNPLTGKIIADARRLPLKAASCRVLTANCVLQWLPDPIATLKHWRSEHPHALIAAAFFIEGTLMEWQSALRSIDNESPHSFISEAALDSLKEQSFIHIDTLRAHYPDAHAALKAIHRIGAGTAASTDFPRLSPAILRRALAAYPLQEGQATVSYRTAWVLWPAQKIGAQKIENKPSSPLQER
jgi:malonyl-CoA O-methyltransferase